jgi:hypothetical protein
MHGSCCSLACVAVASAQQLRSASKDYLSEYSPGKLMLCMSPYPIGGVLGLHLSTVSKQVSKQVVWLLCLCCCTSCRELPALCGCHQLPRVQTQAAGGEQDFSLGYLDRMSTN